MRQLNFSILLYFLIIGFINAQFFFQPQWQPFGGFNQPFNQNQQRPQQFFRQIPLTTTLAPIPDPDKEPGNFPLPNPNDWPIGPDWNDLRNTPDQQLGWGGNGKIQQQQSQISSTPIPPSTHKAPTRKRIATKAENKSLARQAPKNRPTIRRTKTTKN